MKKIIVYLLAAVVIFSTLTAFVGCDNSGEGSGEQDTSEVVHVGEVEFPDVERKDYGEEFNIYIAPANGEIGRWYMDADINTGSAMDEAVFARQERVRKYLGVEFINVLYPDATYTTYHTYVQSAVQNMDGTLDALITHVHGGVPNMISENLLMDLWDLPSLDFGAEYWHEDFMSALELNRHYFLGHSDYVFLMTYVLGYNKELLDEYGAALEKSVYDTVRDYEWTLDEMMKLAQLVAIDSTGNGKSEDDYFGLTGNSWVGFNGFLTACNVPIAAQTQSGTYEISLSWVEYKSKTYDIIEYFKELADGNYTYITQDYRMIHVKTPLSTGRSLMQVISVRDLEGLLNYNLDFGILPFPMYDRDQASVGYRSLQFGGYIGVLSYQDNLTLVSDTIEMLSYYSENVKITYYEKVLGKRIADMPDDAAMFEIVWDGITPDFGQTFTNLGYDELGVCYAIPQMIHPETTQNLASYLDARGTSLNAGFKKFLDGID